MFKFQLIWRVSCWRKLVNLSKISIFQIISDKGEIYQHPLSGKIWKRWLSNKKQWRRFIQSFNEKLPIWTWCKSAQSFYCYVCDVSNLPSFLCRKEKNIALFCLVETQMTKVEGMKQSFCPHPHPCSSTHISLALFQFKTNWKISFLPW